MRTLILATLATLAACGTTPNPEPVELSRTVVAETVTQTEPPAEPTIDADKCAELVAAANAEETRKVADATKAEVDFLEFVEDVQTAVGTKPIARHLPVGHAIAVGQSYAENDFSTQNCELNMAGETVFNRRDAYTTRTYVDFDGTGSVLLAKALYHDHVNGVAYMDGDSDEATEARERFFLDSAANPATIVAGAAKALGIIDVLSASEALLYEEALNSARKLALHYLVLGTYEEGKLLSLTSIVSNAEWAKESEAYESGRAHFEYCNEYAEAPDCADVEMPEITSRLTPEPGMDEPLLYNGRLDVGFWTRRYLDAERLGFDPDYTVWAQRVSLVIVIDQLGLTQGGYFATQLLAEADAVPAGKGKTAFVDFLERIAEPYRVGTVTEDELNDALSERL